MDLLEDAGLRPEEIEEIRSAFFDQARGALESLTDGILALEGEVPSEERLRPLRRAAHTLKSDCAAVGFPELSSLSHALEDAFAGIEARGRAVSSSQSDVLLAALDVFAAGLGAGAAGTTMPPMNRTLDGLRMLALEPEDGQGWDEHLTEAGRQQLRQAISAGRHAVILRSRSGGARATQRLRAAARQLGLDILATPAARGRGGR